MTALVAVIVGAVAAGLGNFATSVSIGLSGVGQRTRLRVAAVFCLFESGMPLVGILLGHGVADIIGTAARYGGGALLIGVGGWTLWRARASDDEQVDSTMPLSRLLVAALALSVDNLVIGFGLGVQHVSLAEAVIVFAVTTVALSLVGLEVGQRLGAKVESRSEWLAGAILASVGVLIAAGVV